MKVVYWIIGIVIVVVALVLGYYYVQSPNTTSPPLNTSKCEFGGNVDKCNTACEINADCKFSIGYCVNINESVFLPEGTTPAYMELNCSCENKKCVGNSTGVIAI